MSQFDAQEESVSSTVSAVEQMTRCIESLDANIERQNNSIVESSTAVEELIAQIKGITSSAEEAETCMGNLLKSSGQGHENMQSVSSLVHTISEKSYELEEANTLISGIAAQTTSSCHERRHRGGPCGGFGTGICRCGG